VEDGERTAEPTKWVTASAESQRSMGKRTAVTLFEGSTELFIKVHGFADSPVAIIRHPSRIRAVGGIE